VNNISPKRARELLERFPRASVLVLGDLMLDRFVRGEVHRICPEAPVPVVRVRQCDDHLGGAGNVAANLRSLGGEVVVAGAVGTDAAGERVREMLAALGVDTGALLGLASRSTTTKTRVIAHQQQVVRIDDEETVPLPPAAVTTLTESVMAWLDQVQLLVVSDYAKGVIEPGFLGRVLEEARRRGLPTTIDPKVQNMAHYQPATVVTPNQGEASQATGLAITGDEEALEAGRHLLGRLDVDALLMTRGEKGMLLCRRNETPLFLPTVAREVYDVTGAGDTVIAALSLALAAGATLQEAAILANRAASVVVGKLGTATCSATELEGAMRVDGGMS
jgi:D-beta-D-heptose 7-phosphate kinase/D-beta-D-heptose 1-phosphate adenosyltransferase